MITSKYFNDEKIIHKVIRNDDMELLPVIQSDFKACLMLLK